MGFNARVGTETPEKKTGSEKSAQCKQPINQAMKYKWGEEVLNA